MSASKYDIDVDLGEVGTSHRYIVELVGSNKSVLDVGCASGYHAKTLEAFGNTVTGVKYDPDPAAEATPHPPVAPPGPPRARADVRRPSVTLGPMRRTLR